MDDEEDEEDKEDGDKEETHTLSLSFLSFHFNPIE